MSKTPDLCRLCRVCAGSCAGEYLYKSTMCRVCRVFCTFPCVCVCAYLRPHAHTHSPARRRTRHTRHTRHTRLSTPYFSFKKKMMEETQTKTIRCTPENASEMQQMVKAWPQLHALVQTLQAQNLFPGLRALSVTLSGPESFVAGGVGAITQLNALKRD